MRFVNFDEDGCCGFGWTRIQGICSTNCGGYQLTTKGLKWVNADNKGCYAWTFEGQIKDRDGTLIGETGDATSIAANVNKTVLTCTGTLPPSCDPFPKFSGNNGSLAACACPKDLTFHRWAFNNIEPESLLYKEIRLTNRYGNTTMPYKFKSVSHKRGWHTVNVGKEETLLEFVDGEQITNISYTGVHHNFDPVSGGENVMKQFF